MEVDLGELVYVDKEGWEQAEEWRKRKYRWSGKIAPAAFIILISIPVVMLIDAYTPSIISQLKGWNLPITIGSILVGLALAVISRLGKKELKKKYKPVKVYENGISFTEWYMSHGVIDKVNYITLTFDEIEWVGWRPNELISFHSPRKRDEPIQMWLGDDEIKEYERWLYQRMTSDPDKLLEIVEEKDIPIRTDI